MSSPLQEAGPLPQMQALHIVPTPGNTQLSMNRMIAQNLLVGLITLGDSVMNTTAILESLS